MKKGHKHLGSEHRDDFWWSFEKTNNRWRYRSQGFSRAKRFQASALESGSSGINVIPMAFRWTHGQNVQLWSQSYGHHNSPRCLMIFGCKESESKCKVNWKSWWLVVVWGLDFDPFMLLLAVFWYASSLTIGYEPANIFWFKCYLFLCYLVLYHAIPIDSSSNRGSKSISLLRYI